MSDNKQTHEENKEALDSKVEEALKIEDEVKEEVKEVEEKVEEIKEVVEVKKNEEPKEEPEPKEEVIEQDYKKKFIESSKEAQVLSAKNKKTNQSLKEALKVPLPTEEELSSEYSDWDVMSDFEKKMAKNDMFNSRRLAKINEIAEENDNISAWNDKVEKYIDDPQVLISNPKLEGKVDEFKLFATKTTRRGVDFEDLVSAFLYEETKTRKPKSKGKMFATGTGGSSKKSNKDGKISIEDARVLRENDYPKWKQMIAEDKIDLDF